MDAPIARLEELRGELAKDWLVRAVDRASLEEIERLPTARVARELPDLIGEIARAADAEEGLGPEPGSQSLEWASRLAELTGREGVATAQIVRDLAQLQSVMIAALHREAGDFDPDDVLAAVERIAELFGSIQTDAVEEALRNRSQELEWLGSTDGLTGLHNARYLQQHIHHLIGVQKRYGHPFAVLLVDIDGLKRINDAYGSVAGDRALVSVATALGEVVRSVDTPVRMGGDEFCVLLPNQTATRARVLAERLADALEAVESPGGKPLRVSIGVVSCPQHGTEAEALLELADAAMYRAKAAGERVAVGPEAATSANGANGNGD